MRRLANLVTLIALMFLIQGCQTGLILREGSAVRKFDELMREHRYSDARKLLEKLPEAHPDYPGLIRHSATVNRLYAELEGSNLRKIREHINGSRWQDADRLLNVSISQLPDSIRLKQVQKDFEYSRNLRLLELEFRSLMRESTHFVAARNDLAAMYEIKPTKALKARQNEVDRRLNEISVDLVICAEKALNNRSWLLAESCYRSSLEVAENADIRSKLSKLNSVIEDTNEQDAEQTLRLQDLERAYLAAVAERRWLDARTSLKRIRSIAPVNERYAANEVELDEMIHNHIFEKREEGQRHYSTGRIEDALIIWRSLLKLAPGDQGLLDKISRGENVLEKLGRLKE